MKNIIKLISFLCLGLSLMGNEGCQKEPAPAPEGRVLKKTADLSRLTSPKMILPDGKPFDFEYLVNAQIYDVIGKHNKFIVPFTPATNTSFEAASLGIADSDYDRLEDWQLDTRNRVMAANQAGVPECLKRGPQVEIGGAVESFEIQGGGGLFFGFGPNVGGVTDVGGSIRVQFAQLATTLIGYHPLSKVVSGTGRARSTQTRVDLDLTINFGLFRLGPQFFFQSPLANVSRRALDQTLVNLSNDMDQKAEADGRPVWETKVRNDLDTHVIIYGGRRHGLKVGDEMAVYNMQHYWENDGTPCAARYEGALRKSDLPAAILKIETSSELGDDITRARVIQQGKDQREPGAQVVMWKMVEDDEGADGEMADQMN